MPVCLRGCDCVLCVCVHMYVFCACRARRTEVANGAREGEAAVDVAGVAVAHHLPSARRHARRLVALVGLLCCASYLYSWRMLRTRTCIGAGTSKRSAQVFILSHTSGGTARRPTLLTAKVRPRHTLPFITDAYTPHYAEITPIVPHSGARHTRSHTQEHTITHNSKHRHIHTHNNAQVTRIRVSTSSKPYLLAHTITQKTQTHTST